MSTNIYEAHITIEPVLDQALDNVKAIAERFGFHVADLLMQKRKEDTPQRSKFDTFMTGHGNDYKMLTNNLRELCKTLKQNNVKVYRYKIEEIILDSRVIDVFSLL